MSAHKRITLGIAVALLAIGVAVLPACSSEDDATTGDSNDPGTETADAGDGATTDDSGTTSAMACDEVLTLAEVEALFGEPAVLEDLDAKTNNAQIGQTACTWTTIEDEANTDDLSSQLLVLQHYAGNSTVSGENFYDPEVQYPGSTPLDIGDEGFIDTEGGIDIGFVDGDSSGFLSWTVIDLGGGEPDQAAAKDTMIELARTFQERVS